MQQHEHEHKGFEPRYAQAVRMYLDQSMRRFPHEDGHHPREVSYMTPTIPLNGGNSRFESLDIMQCTPWGTMEDFGKSGASVQVSFDYKNPENTPEDQELPVFVRFSDGTMKLARGIDYVFFTDGTAQAYLHAQDIETLGEYDLYTNLPDQVDLAAFKSRLFTQAAKLDQEGRVPVYTGAVEERGDGSLRLDYTNNPHAFALLTDTLANFSRQYANRGVPNYELFMTEQLGKLN